MGSIFSMFSGMNVFAGGAILSLLIGQWQSIKNLIWKVCNIAVKSVEIEDYELKEWVIGHLIENYKMSAYDAVYSQTYTDSKKDRKVVIVPHEIFGKKSIIFWNGWFPFYVSIDKAGESEGKGGTPQQQQQVGPPSAKGPLRITFLRFGLCIEDIVKKACLERERKTSNDGQFMRAGRNFFIKHFPSEAIQGGSGGQYRFIPWFREPNIRLLMHAPEDLGNFQHSKNALDSLFFPSRIKSLIGEVRRWKGSKQWYEDRNIPWKMGWLLYGEPGTGKSALARALAEDEDMPIFVFRLGEMGNKDFIKSWKGMLSSVPCIALFEDFDNVFNGRTNVSPAQTDFFSMMDRKRPSQSGGKDGEDDSESQYAGGKLSFDVFLNTIDGVDRSEGVFTIITTNDKSKIDPALGVPRTLLDGSTECISTRPGRLNKAIHLGYMEKPEMRAMAKHILNGYSDELLEMSQHIEKSDIDETPAQFQERCAQIALKRFWAEKDAKVEALDIASPINRGDSSIGLNIRNNRVSASTI